VVSTEHGKGRITTVGTLPNVPLAADLLSWLVPHRLEVWGRLPESVTVSSATNRDGQRIHVVHNWSWQPITVGLPEPMVDLLAAAATPVQEISLGAWDVQVLAAV
jgi:beta-galactosidase